MRKGSIVIFFLTLLNQINAQQMELIAGHVLFRHGDRTPISTYPTDPMKRNDWPNGYGQLTAAGIEQGYRLGVYFRARYGSLLNSIYNRSEIYVRSTDYDRTLMTAQSSLVGLYPLPNNSNSSVPIQPVPVHTAARRQDTLLSFRGCPGRPRIKKNKYQRDELERLNTYYEPFFKKLQVWTNISTISMYHTAHMSDTIFIENIYNKTPSWATADVQKNLSDIHDNLFRLAYSNPGVKRIRGGPVVKDMWQNMNRSIHGDSYLKLKMYSAHDTTVSAVLSFLGMKYIHQPPYASAIFVDFYKQNYSYFVKVEYLNVTDSKIAYPHVLNGCEGVECPFDKFTTTYQSRFPADFNIECAAELPSSPSDRRMLIGIICLIIAILVLISIISLLLMKICSQRKEYDEPLIANETSSLKQ